MRSFAVMIAALAALLASAPTASAADRDCSDFANQKEAQEYFESKGGPQQDPDRLDGDNDGKACDTLPCPCAGEQRPRPRRRATRTPARITSVVDGDTIRARSLRTGRRYTVRLIGIDTPETKRPNTPIECGGPEASSRMLQLGFTAPQDTDGDGLFDAKGGRGRRVRLTTDPTQDKRDRYGRLLAYVTRRADRKNLGEAQLRAGWAKVYVFREPFRLLERFRRAQRSAREAGRGVWGMCEGDFHRPR